MVLSKVNKLRLKLAGQQLQFLRISLWITVIYEFYGPVNAWSKLLKRIANEEMSKDINKHDIVALLKHAYGNFSYKKPHPKRPLFLTHLYTVLFVYDLRRLTRFFPIDYRVQSKEHTNKNDYLREKSTYRLSHSVVRSGYDLKPHYYKEYKHIAKKYQWPLIYNGDDSEV